MKKIILTAAAVSLVLLYAFSAFAADPKGVLDAKGIYTEVNGLVKAGKLRVMQTNAPLYSAPHGVVRTVVTKFYFTESTALDKKQTPITGKMLRKITVTTSYAAGKPMETNEFYFDGKGRFVFYYSNADITEEALNEHHEDRYYFAGNRLVSKLVRASEEVRPLASKTAKPQKILKDANFTPDMKKYASDILKRKDLLKDIFEKVYRAWGFI
jgi:hypothetical protein